LTEPFACYTVVLRRASSARRASSSKSNYLGQLVPPFSGVGAPVRLGEAILPFVSKKATANNYPGAVHMEHLLRELIAINREMLSEIKMLRQSLNPAVGQTQQIEQLFDQPDPVKSPPPRYTPEDLEDMHGALVEGLKQRNKEKSNAFSEFEKRHKDW
jgi:hypothetical protein